MFFLPVASGGLLEYVRDVVAETIAQKEALGLPVYSARALLWDGDAARAVRDFQRSSRRYGQAYRMATHAIAGEIAPEQD